MSTCSTYGITSCIFSYGYHHISLGTRTGGYFRNCSRQLVLYALVEGVKTKKNQLERNGGFWWDRKTEVIGGTARTSLRFKIFCRIFGFVHHPAQEGRPRHYKRPCTLAKNISLVLTGYNVSICPCTTTTPSECANPPGTPQYDGARLPRLASRKSDERVLADHHLETAPAVRKKGDTVKLGKGTTQPRQQKWNLATTTMPRS